MLVPWDAGTKDCKVSYRGLPHRCHTTHCYIELNLDTYLLLFNHINSRFYNVFHVLPYSASNKSTGLTNQPAQPTLKRMWVYLHWAPILNSLMISLTFTNSIKFCNQMPLSTNSVWNFTSICCVIWFLKCFCRLFSVDNLTPNIRKYLKMAIIII